MLGSVRFRVTVAAALAVGLVLGSGSVVLVAAQGRQVATNLDRTLSQRADDLEADLLAGRLPRRPAAAQGSEVGVIQVLDRSGTIVAASANSSGDPAIAPPPPVGTDQVFRTVGRLPVDDDTFRILSRQVDAPSGPFVLHVAASADAIAESTAALRRSLAIGVPVMIVALAALTWLLVGRTLRPIEGIRREVAAISGDQRGGRVAQPAGTDEVARLAATMNEMLDRLDGAAERQRRFVADASHDLRSPLAVIRAEIEIDLAHPDRADPLATNRRLLRSIDRLQRLTNDLLVLARSDSSVPDGHSAAVLDLDDAVRTEVELVRRSARVPVDTSRVSAAQVRGDDEGMGRLVVNLLDNAVRHASTAVTVELAEDGGRAVLAVVDDGPGIAEADRTRIFERFVRLDDARRSDGRNGLGLAIVAEIAARHGGTVEVDPLHDPGARIVVSMPVATP